MNTKHEFKSHGHKNRDVGVVNAVFPAAVITSQIIWRRRFLWVGVPPHQDLFFAQSHHNILLICALIISLSASQLGWYSITTFLLSIDGKIDQNFGIGHVAFCSPCCHVIAVLCYSTIRNRYHWLGGTRWQDRSGGRRVHQKAASRCEDVHHSWRDPCDSRFQSLARSDFRGCEQQGDQTSSVWLTCW